MPIESINPCNGNMIRSYDEHSADEVNAIIGRVARAQRRWRDVGFGDRSSRMREVGRLLRERGDTYATLMASEMGKPVVQARAEVEKCAWGCDYYAEMAEEFLTAEEVATDAVRSRVVSSLSASSLPSCHGIFRSGRFFDFSRPLCCRSRESEVF